MKHERFDGFRTGPLPDPYWTVWEAHWNIGSPWHGLRQLVFKQLRNRLVGPIAESPPRKRIQTKSNPSFETLGRC